jgi:hypothetical protein
MNKNWKILEVPNKEALKINKNAQEVDDEQHWKSIAKRC